MLVIALHTAYLATWMFDLVPPREQMLLALAAYVTYVVNAGQFLLKFREARPARRREPTPHVSWAGAGK
jgi:3-vinyl bacteriochlorophyllide hydratase